MLIPNMMSFRYTGCICTIEDGINHLKDINCIQLQTVQFYDENNDDRINQIVIDNYSRLHAMQIRDKMNTSCEYWLTCFHMLALERGYVMKNDFQYIEKKNDEGETIRVKKPAKEIIKNEEIKDDIVHAENIRNIIEEKTYDDKMANKKYMIVHNLGIENLDDATKDKYVNIYTKNERQIKNLMKINLKEPFTNEYDNYDDKMFQARVDLFNESIDAFNLKDNKEWTFESAIFNEILDGIKYDEVSLKVLRSNCDKKLLNNIDIFKMSLNAFGYDYKKTYIRTNIYENGERRTIRIPSDYIININNDIMKICKLLTVNKNYLYSEKFIQNISF